MPQDALIARCVRIAPCTWSDALDSLGIDGVLRGLPMRSGKGRFAGLAATVRAAAGPLGSFDKSEFGVPRMVDLAAPDTVLVVDVGGAEVSMCGGNAALACYNGGASAVIIDGACRDIDEIRETGLWLASRHVTPTTGKRRIRLEETGGTVTVGGIRVGEGDLVVGDETGIVAVPAADIPRALAAAEAMKLVDDRLAAAIRAGKSFAEAASGAGYL